MDLKERINGFVIEQQQLLLKTDMYFLPIDKLSEYRAYPTFFKDRLKSIKDGIEHIVTYEY